VESRAEGTVPVNGLLKRLGHSIEIDGDLGFHGDEVALVGTPLSSTKALHRLIDNGDVPSPGVVVFEL
jgi:hypothetical protein